MARSIAAGGPITNLGSPHLWFFPGYSILISPAFLVADRPFLLLAFMHWLFLVGFVLGVWYWARRLESSSAFWVAALSIANALILGHFRRTYSEAAFMAVLMASANVLAMAVAGGTGMRGWCWAALGGLLTAVLTLIRPAGITLAAGFGVLMLVQCCRRGMRWRSALAMTALVALPAMLAVAGMMTRAMITARQNGEATYLDNFAAASYLEGIRLVVSDCGRHVVPGMFKSYAGAGSWFNINLAIYLSVMGAVLFGWWRLVRRRLDALALMFPLYLLLHVGYAMDSGARLLSPMIPVLIVSLWYALESVRWRPLILKTALACHLVVAAGHWLACDLPATRRINADWPDVDRLAKAIDTNAGVIVAEQLPKETVLMLEFAIDRPVKLIPQSETTPDARWLIVPSDQPPQARTRVFERAGCGPILLALPSVQRYAE